MKPPLIVIGCHRSGTSALCRMYMERGVWMYPPVERNQNAESEFFLACNERLLHLNGMAWDRPAGVDLVKPPADLLCGLAQHFNGNGRYEECEWGFKDPRTTILWRVWRQVFPEARWVRILRNGLDVAASLWRRESNTSGRSYTDWFQVWIQYVNEGNEAVAALGERCEVVRYEDLVKDGTFRKVAKQPLPAKQEAERRICSNHPMLKAMGYGA